MELSRGKKDWKEESLAARAQVMAAATRRLEVICKERVNPGGKHTAGLLVGSLQPMGYARMRGVRDRPKLRRKDVVNQVFLEEAVRASTEGRQPNLKHAPDITNRAGPLWRHGNDMMEKGRADEGGNADEGGQTEEEEAEKGSALPIMAKKLEHRRVLSTTQWSEEEQKSIERMKGERKKTRERNRLLHNRYARERGQHILMGGPTLKMKCAECKREAEWRRVLQWPRTRCMVVRRKREEEKRKKAQETAEEKAKEEEQKENKEDAVARSRREESEAQQEQ